MRDASTLYAETVTGSHQIATRADVLFDREVIAEDLPIVDGVIRYNRTAAHLAALTCTLIVEDRLPATATDQLTPYGYELRVWRGIPGELLPLGTFPIQRSVAEAIDRRTVIDAIDRSQLVSDARFEDDYAVTAGQNIADAIEALIDDGVPGLTYEFPSTTYTAPAFVFGQQTDRWQAAQRMAASIGHEILFDGLGVCVMRPEPTFNDQAVATIADASNLKSATVALDRTPAYNKVIAYSLNASTGAQYRGEAYDDDPQSPTYYLGAFGKKPRFFASEFINSNAQALDAAMAILASELGVAKRFQIAALPDMRLECSDVVRVVNTAFAVDALHIIDEITVGLGPEAAMSIVARAQEGLVVGA